MLKRKKKVIAKVMATTMLATTIATTFGIEANADSLTPRTAVSSSKIAGGDRYKTAVEISKNYSSSSKHAVIVNGQKGIVDALTATPYASLKNAPILMTQSNKLNADTKAELTRRQVKTVDIVGGLNSVNDSVKAEIEAMGITVTRIAGTSKYDTALEVAKKIDAISDISKIAVANGEVLADAVSVAAPAAQNKMPIILAHPKNGLDEKTKSYINGENISNSYVIGGTNSVSSTTQNSLPGYKKRLEGSGRQDTNAAVVKEFYTNSSYDNVYVTKSGQVNKTDEIADALAVGVLASKEQDPVVIVGKSLADSQSKLLTDKSFTKVTEIGNGIPTPTIEAIKNTQSTIKNVTTVSALNSALNSAKDGDTINFESSKTTSENISIDTSKKVTVNLDSAISSTVTIDAINANVNINDDMSGKVAVEEVSDINIKSGVTVKQLEVKATAKNASIDNRGTITTFDVLATGVKINNTGKIETLNQQGDTIVEGNGTIGNIDTTKPVSQVIAQNGKELVIKFSKPVDKDTVVKGGDLLNNTNASITKIGDANEIDNTNAKAELSENRMTLTITAKADQFFKGTYKLDLQNVYSNGTKLEAYSTTFKVDDNTAPTVASAEFNQDTDKFEITLSEPIDSLDGIVLRVNSKPVTPEAIKAPTKKIIFERSGIALNSSATVYLTGLKDKAGNKMSAYNGTVRTTNSNLSVSELSQISNKELKLTFNKSLDVQSIEDIKVKKGLEVQVRDGREYITITPNTVVSRIDDKNYKITLPNNILDDSDSKNIVVKIVKYKDASNKDITYKDATGTMVSETTKETTIRKDKTAPTVKSTVLSTDKKGIEVTMNENVTIKNANGASIRMNGYDLTNVSIEMKPDSKDTLIVKTTDKLAVTDDNKLKAGKYQVRLEKGAVVDSSELGNEAVTLSIVEVTEESTKTLDIKSIENAIGANVYNTFKITAPDGEEFVYDSILKATYKIDNMTIDNTKADIKFTDAKRNCIEIKLPSADYINVTDKAEFHYVSGLELKSGNKLNSKTETVQITDNTAPTLYSAKATISKTDNKKAKIILTFNEDVKDLSTSIVNDIKDKIIIRKGSGSTMKTYNWGGESADAVTSSVEGKVLTINITESEKSNLLTEILTLSSRDITIELKNCDVIKDINNVNARDKKVTSSYVTSETIN